MYGNSDYDWHEDENNQIRARAVAHQEAQRTPLTKATITHMAAEHQLYEDLPANEFEVALHKFARAIEAKLKEKNT